LSSALHFPAVRLFGDYLAFFVTYNELMTPPRSVTEYQRPLLTEAQLLARTSNVDHLGAEWMSQYTDVVNLALAQEVLYSGLPTARAFAELMARQNFGRSSGGPVAKLRDAQAAAQANEATPATAAAWRKLATLYGGEAVDDPTALGRLGFTKCSGASLPQLGDEELYLVGICHFENNVYFRANVMTALVAYALEKNKVPAPVLSYRLAFHRPVDDYGLADWTTTVLKGWPVAKPAKPPENGDPGWTLKYISADGSEREVALPAPFFVERQPVLYSPQFAYIREFKDTTAQRLLFFSLQAQKHNGAALRDDPAYQVQLRRLAASSSNPLKFDTRQMQLP
jgi:hypothetical protein